MSSTQTQVLSHVGPIDWIDFAQRWVSNGERAVFIMVTALRGSAPRGYHNEHGPFSVANQLLGKVDPINWADMR